MTDSPLLVELLVLLVLVLVNGVLAGAEIAIVAMRWSRVQELLAKGRPAARALAGLRRVPERFLSTVQIGITVVGAAAGAFGGAKFAPDVQPWIERVPLVGAYAGQVSLVLVVLLVSYMTVVLGELVPKSIALRSSERYALFVARPLELLSWVVLPAVRLLTASSNAVLRLFGVRTSFAESRLSADELRSLVDEASDEGEVQADAGEIAARALEFGRLTAEDVMVHRRFVVSLAVDAPLAEVRRVFLEHGHQRVPVHDGSIDRVLGYVSWRDVFVALLKGEELDLRDALRPCPLVPESMSAPALLEQMRGARQHIALVVDEHGGTAGIITMEDLLEEFVGEIDSEHAEPPPAPIHRETDGAVLVLGTTPIRDVNRELGLALPEPRGGTTVGGLCMELASGHIPKKGERFETADGTALEVLDSSPRRVRRLRLHLARRATEAEGGDARRASPARPAPPDGP